MKRRTFLAGGLAAITLACGRRKAWWRFLTADEAHTLEAICTQIIPEDRDPGARRAGAVHFIDTQLTGFYRPLQETYRNGLAEIDRESVKFAGRPFAELPADRQFEFLKRIESNPFFDLLIDHTMQGFYGDPRHGGNFERVSWKMLGLAYPPVRGRLRYDLADPAKGERPWG